MAKYQSRAKRFEEAMSLIETGKAEMEELVNELESWRDNLPENLREGTKADELQNAISDLESIIASLDEAMGITPEFPGMFS